MCTFTLRFLFDTHKLTPFSSFVGHFFTTLYRAKEEKDIIQQDPEQDSEDSTEVPRKRNSGRRKIKIEYIEDKNRRHITFSKRKAGIMKKVIVKQKGKKSCLCFLLTVSIFSTPTSFSAASPVCRLMNFLL
jgi:hypothetical protein